MEKLMDASNLEKVMLKNEKLDLEVCPERGNVITSLVFDEKELIFIKPDNLASDERPTCGCPVLFPYSGNNKDDMLLIKGKEYVTGIHGIVHTNNWKYEEGDSTQNIGCFSTGSNEETKKIFPYDFSLTSRIELKGNELYYQLGAKNNTDDLMPCDFGLHPFFKISHYDNLDIEWSKDGQNYSSVDSKEVLASGQLLKNCKILKIIDKELGVKFVFSNVNGFNNMMLWSGNPNAFIVVEPLTAQPNSINEGVNAYNLKGNESVDNLFCIKLETL